MLKDDLVDKVVETITRVGHRNPGWKDIFYDIEKAVRIKTFQTEEAL